MKTTELDNLDKISKESLYSHGIMSSAIKYCFRSLKRHLHGNRVLELGPAVGVMTELLSELSLELTVVEGHQYSARVFASDFRGRK